MTKSDSQLKSSDIKIYISISKVSKTSSVLGPKTHCITIVVLLPRGQVKTTFKGKNMDTYHHTNHQISFSFFHRDFFQVRGCHFSPPSSLLVSLVFLPVRWHQWPAVARPDRLVSVVSRQKTEDNSLEIRARADDAAGVLTIFYYLEI